MRRPTLGLIRAAISHYYDEWETCTPHQTCQRCKMSDVSDAMIDNGEYNTSHY